MSGVEFGSSADDLSFARVNRKTRLCDTASNINAATKQGHGQTALCTSANANIPLGRALSLESTNTVWQNQWAELNFPLKWGQYMACSSTFSNNVNGILKVASTTGSLSLNSFNTSEGLVSQFNTGTNAGDTAGFNMGLIYTQRSMNPCIKFRFRLDQTTDIRMFIGWTGSTSLVANSEDPLNTLVGYGLAKLTASGNFRVIHNDASGATVDDDTGIAVDTNYHTVELYGNHDVGAWYTVLDGVLENTSTTEVPASFTLSMQVTLINTTGGAARTIRVPHGIINTDR